MNQGEHWESFRDSRAHFIKFPTAENGEIVKATYRAWVSSDPQVTESERHSLCSSFDRHVAQQIARAAA